ncbi:hypothetical protein CPB85DRAFT_1556174 [Mucidula mucida]|nr:hypothetical protein CPB85DRAFT_1556174 [Mucidula mucida]
MAQRIMTLRASQEISLKNYIGPSTLRDSSRTRSTLSTFPEIIAMDEIAPDEDCLQDGNEIHIFPTGTTYRPLLGTLACRGHNPSSVLMFNLVLVALSFTSGGLANAVLVVNTPLSLTECQPVSLSWSGGTRPFFPDSNGAVLKEFGQVGGTSLTWVVDVPADTEVAVDVVDSTGEVAQTAFVKISQGDDTNCLA